MVPSCVREPTGGAIPRRIKSTPDIKVVLTAPIPGMSTPNLPFAGAMLTGLRIQFPLFALVLCEMIRHSLFGGVKMQKQRRYDARRLHDLQICLRRFSENRFRWV